MNEHLIRFDVFAKPMHLAPESSADVEYSEDTLEFLNNISGAKVAEIMCRPRFSKWAHITKAALWNSMIDHRIMDGRSHQMSLSPDDLKYFCTRAMNLPTLFYALGGMIVEHIYVREGLEGGEYRAAKINFSYNNGPSMGVIVRRAEPEKHIPLENWIMHELRQFAIDRRLKIITADDERLRSALLLTMPDDKERDIAFVIKDGEQKHRGIVVRRDVVYDDKVMDMLFEVADDKLYFKSLPGLEVEVKYQLVPVDWSSDKTAIPSTISQEDLSKMMGSLFCSSGEE